MYSGSFTMSGGGITGNQAGGDGKGVSIGGSVSCQLSGTAKVTENTGSGKGNLYINGGNAERSITNLTTGAQLGICFSRPGDMQVATGDLGSLGYLKCENEGYVFTLENSNELWVKLNRMEIVAPPTGQEDLTYDGSSHELVSAGTAGAGGTMRYAVTLSGSGKPGRSDFSPNLPRKTDAGKYTVWYYVPSDGKKADSDMKSLNVEIAPIPLGVEWVKTTLTYNGHSQQPTATLTGRVDNDHVWLEINNPPTDAGTYTITKEDLKLDGSDAGNYFLADGVQGTNFEIQKKTLTVTANSNTIIYGDAPANAGVTYNGFVKGENENVLGGQPDYTYTYKQYDDVGIYEITPKGLTSNNYDITFEKGTLTVDRKTISINWGETTRTYDGTPWAPSATAGGMVNGDALTLTVSGEKTDADDYTAAVTEIQGDKAGNYKLPDHPTTSFTITKADAQFTPPTARKGLIYNDENQELINPGSSEHGTFQYWLEGEQPGESIPQARVAGTYTVRYQLVGDKNHNDGQVSPIDVTIAPKDIKNATVTLGDSLTYNGREQTQIVSSVQVDGLNVMCDVTDRTGTNAGSYKMTLKGIGNFTGTKEVPWSIAKKDVTIQDVVVEARKVYDGTDNAAITDSGRLSDNFDGKDLTIHMGTAVYDNKNTGTDKTVTFTGFSLEGSAAGNYQLTGQPEATTASISPRPVTVSGITAQDKTYDGNTQVTLVYEGVVLEGNVDGDKLTVTAEGSFEDANVGSKQVNITGLTLGGAEQGNYVLAESGQQTGATAAITANSRYLDLGGVDLGEDGGTVWIDGEKQPINTDGGSHMLLPEEAGFLTTYTYSQSGGGNDYPTGMKVYRFRRADTGVTLEEIPEFENLLLYGGCSIRLTGTKGIRMITGISEATRAGLTGAQGLAGYTLEEYGTVVMRGTGTPTLENSQSHNYAYKKGQADPIFGRTGGRIQFTNVLVGFSLKDCKETLTLRPYIILKDTATGEAVTLYGGCVTRSIGYVAKQNANTYQPGTAGYNYVHEIIHAVYGA